MFVLALVLRFAYLVDLRSTPFFAHPQMDALYHDVWARRLAGGDWIGTEVFFRAPLYPYFLGTLYALFGPAYTLVRVVQLAVGGITVLLTAAFVAPRFGRLAAVAAGLLVACHAPLIYFEGELLLVVLEAPLNLLAAWSIDRAVRKGGLRPWATAGALLGAGALVRPTLLAVAPVVGVYLLVRSRTRGLRPALAYAGAVLLVLSPVLLRNYAVGNDVVPVASQGGLNFYLGNNPAADGMSAVAPEFRRTWTGGIEDAERLAELAEGRPLRPSEISRYWFGRALSWAGREPGRFLGHQLAKLGYFWDAYEIPNNQDYYYFSRLTRILSLPVLSGFWLLGPLALAGLVIGAGRRRLGFGWIAVPAVLTLVIVAFFVCARFRASLVPLFAVWAGVGISLAVDSLRTGRRGWLTIYLAVLVLAGVHADADLRGLRADHSFAESHLRLGIFHASRGEEARAREHYELAVRENPDFAEGWNNLGVLHAEAGRLTEAREAFARALETQPDHPKALGNQAALAFAQGRRADADSLARRTLRVAGREPTALYNAAVVLGNLGNAETALAAFRALLRFRPDHAAARVGEARALIVLGRVDEAREALREHPPGSRSAELEALLRKLEGLETP